jgi:hypothetical protein
MGTQYVEGPLRTFTVGASDIPAFARVKLSSGLLVIAGIGDKELGTLETIGKVGELAAVRLRNAPGTFIGIAAGAIAVGADVSTAASGKFNDTAGTGSFLSGTAITAAAADGDYIEILRHLQVGAAAS